MYDSYMMNPFDERIYSTFLKTVELSIFFSCDKMSFCSISEKWKSYRTILQNMFLGNEGI
jgi:hypothetical protein